MKRRSSVIFVAVLIAALTIASSAGGARRVKAVSAVVQFSLSSTCGGSSSMTYTWSGFHGVSYVKGEVDDVTGGGDTLVSNGPMVTVRKSSGSYSVHFGDNSDHTYYGFAQLYDSRGQAISNSLGHQMETASCNSTDA